MRLSTGEDEVDDTRQYLVYLVRALGNIGSEAQAAVPFLQQAQALVADDSEMNKLVRWAIRRCRGKG